MKKFIIAFLIFAAGCSSAPPKPTYQEGRTDGLEVGRQMKQTQEYSNDQINEIVDGAVKDRREKIYSAGKEYGDGWIAGIKEGMRR
jgi:hypothetical protein